MRLWWHTAPLHPSRLARTSLRARLASRATSLGAASSSRRVYACLCLAVRSFTDVFLRSNLSTADSAAPGLAHAQYATAYNIVVSVAIMWCLLCPQLSKFCSAACRSDAARQYMMQNTFFSVSAVLQLARFIPSISFLLCRFATADRFGASASRRSSTAACLTSTPRPLLRRVCSAAPCRHASSHSRRCWRARSTCGRTRQSLLQARLCRRIRLASLSSGVVALANQAREKL